MSNDQHIPYLICRKLIGTITAEEEATLNEWIASSSHHQRVYRRLMQKERLDMEMRRLQVADHRRPLADMRRRLGIDGHTALHTFRMGYRWAAAAAVLILLVVGTTLLWKRQSEPPSATRPTATTIAAIKHGTTQAILTLDNGEQVALGADSMANRQLIAQAAKGEDISYSHLQTPRGGEFRVVLEDGTEVWLNADTKLRYPEHFDDTERRVEIEGEAYFRVAPDSEKPFYVISGGQEVRVYGTEFNVNAYSDEQSTYTTLVKGSISLKTLGGNGSELMLTPGHQAVYDKQVASAKVKSVDTDVVTSWRSGTFVFEDQTLGQIMRTLSRWYDFEYEFADESVASIVFMGSIPRYGSFKEVADIFQKMGGIGLKLHGEKIIISTQP